MTISPVVISVLKRPDAEIALVGIDTPLNGLSISASNSPQIAIIITASLGTLSAAIFPGATISGDGTHSLWIAGSPADVNAKLATLIYSAPLAGTDTLSISLIDASEQNTGPVSLPVNILPLITSPSALDPALTLSGGTLTLDTRKIDGLSLNLQDAQTGAGAATLILVNSTLGTNTAVDIATSDPASPAPRLAVAGKVTLDGITTFEPGPALVTIAADAVLDNAGAIAFLSGSYAQITGLGTLQNDGTITAASASAAAIDVAVAGPGVISLAAGANLTLEGPVSADQTLRFISNSGTLNLVSPQTMQATIEGFEPGDRIELGELPINAAAYTQTAIGGALTLFDGAQLDATLDFAGSHKLGDFLASVATDSASDGGAITSLSVLVPSGPAQGSATATVYRFFETSSGAQLLTQSAAERDAVMATRPDLTFEGIAMDAVASPASDKAATAVSRFFDTVHGTYFFTADSAEQTALVATRPDLVYEPNSTFWEDATQQPGDVPVYRFFDTSTGTHFYTESAAERASILSTRHDLAAEGIAFYAPNP